MAKKRSTNKVGKEAARVSVSVRQLVLHEAGYKCANPCCRHPLTLEVHHLYYTSEGGANSSDNLLPLCPLCHTYHHKGDIPTESLRAWKMLLVSLNEAFDRQSVDILLTLAQLGRIEWITGDGLPSYASLVAANLISLKQQWHVTWGVGRSTQQQLYAARLTEKGQLFVEGWKKGDQNAAIGCVPEVQ